MKCSLIITTYNWPEALELSLNSALNQTILPNEIIVADDGSTNDTKKLIQKFQKKSSINIIHSWQDDKGFRASRSRNLASIKSSYEYLIYVDGDMILDKNFIKDHIQNAKKNYYLQGSRVLLSKEYTNNIIYSKEFIKPSIFSSNSKNKMNEIYSKILSFIYSLFSTNSQKGIRSCNFSFYKNDLLKVNGFNEDFITWGREDSELISRMYNIGIKRKNIKFQAIQYHLFHKEGSSNSLNDSILENVIKNNIKFCKNGINKHLSYSE
jgi:glycosyltransferase involved in cell wall biosynthesis